jgi:hypothetical protein
MNADPFRFWFYNIGWLDSMMSGANRERHLRNLCRDAADAWCNSTSTTACTTDGLLLCEAGDHIHGLADVNIVVDRLRTAIMERMNNVGATKPNLIVTVKHAYIQILDGNRLETDEPYIIHISSNRKMMATVVRRKGFHQPILLCVNHSHDGKDKLSVSIRRTVLERAVMEARRHTNNIFILGGDLNSDHIWLHRTLQSLQPYHPSCSNNINLATSKSVPLARGDCAIMQGLICVQQDSGIGRSYKEQKLERSSDAHDAVVVEAKFAQRKVTFAAEIPKTAQELMQMKMATRRKKLEKEGASEQANNTTDNSGNLKLSSVIGPIQIPLAFSKPNLQPVAPPLEQTHTPRAASTNTPPAAVPYAEATELCMTTPPGLKTFANAGTTTPNTTAPCPPMDMLTTVAPPPDLTSLRTHEPDPNAPSLPNMPPPTNIEVTQPNATRKHDDVPDPIAPPLPNMLPPTNIETVQPDATRKHDDEADPNASPLPNMLPPTDVEATQPNTTRKHDDEPPTQHTYCASFDASANAFAAATACLPTTVSKAPTQPPPEALENSGATEPNISALQSASLVTTQSEQTNIASASIDLPSLPAMRKAIPLTQIDMDDEVEPQEALNNDTAKLNCQPFDLDFLVSGATAYALDGRLYTMAQFKSHYGNAWLQIWRTATAVTTDITLVTEQLAMLQYSLQLRITDDEGIEDALKAVLCWCHGGLTPTVPEPTTSEAPQFRNIFEKLAHSLIKPLWYRQCVLLEHNRSATTDEILNKDMGDAAWVMWRKDFQRWNLLPHQHFMKNKDVRSIFEVAVRKLVGSVHLAKAIISHGARHAKSVQNILLEIYQRKSHPDHQAAVRATHLHHSTYMPHTCSENDEATKLIRRRYKTASKALFLAKQLATTVAEHLDDEQIALVRQYQNGFLWSEYMAARQAKLEVSPPKTRLLSSMLH